MFDDFLSSFARLLHEWADPFLRAGHGFIFQFFPANPQHADHFAGIHVVGHRGVMKHDTPSPRLGRPTDFARRTGNVVDRHVMGIDAFSGDSIPMHLVTREAMAIYLKHLKPDGVIVFQATNRFIDLLPVVRRLAEEFGMEAVNVADTPADENGPEYWYSATDQVIVTRNRRLLDWPHIAEAAEPIEPMPGLPVFTDAHHNLLRILK